MARALGIYTNSQGLAAFQDTSRAFYIVRRSPEARDLKYLLPKDVEIGLNWRRLNGF